MIKSKIIKLTGLSIFLIGASVFANDMPQATRLMLDINSTPQNPTTFHCTVQFPEKNYNPSYSDRIVMMNYGQMIKGFGNNEANDLKSIDRGRLLTTSKVLNNIYFEAYHDPSAFYKEIPGFVDVMVGVPDAKVSCTKGKGKRISNLLGTKPTENERLLVEGTFG
ncbi:MULTISPECIES: hypothetical protein [Cysteiniphilum]|uniref:Uncharacterized protein n=1 Tax=Cysteiniphilum litorale TaxID=2056700 RepID=A0A8J2Z4F2_9GAMM|nr:MULTISPECIES: hypothetical protein [Cysteiniphilum]GGF98902.1 hypothetical protein GCM10010995_15190 [Cysteiniphilum litorale]